MSDIKTNKSPNFTSLNSTRQKKDLIPDRWENFLLSILLHMLFPLLPLLFEFWLGGELTPKSLNLMASVYAISIGVSSRSKLLFGLCIAVSFIFSFAFGISSSELDDLKMSKLFSSISIVIIFCIHVIERYNRHIQERDNFLNF